MISITSKKTLWTICATKAKKLFGLFRVLGGSVVDMYETEMRTTNREKPCDK